MSRSYGGAGFSILSRAQPDLRETRLVRAIGFEMERYFDK